MAISLLMGVTATAACMPGPAPIVMPESPLIPGTNTALVENRFRVVEIIRHGEPMVFDAIQPVFITFDKRGELSKQTTNCNSGVYAIVAERERRYRLIPGAGTVKGCGELAEAQYSKISEAIGATTEYELKGSQLLLRGDDVHIVIGGRQPTLNLTLVKGAPPNIPPATGNRRALYGRPAPRPPGS